MKRSAKPRSAQYKALALNTVAAMLAAGGAPLVGLGEVSPDDVDLLTRAITMSLQVHVDILEETGLAFVYKPDMVEVVAVSTLIDHYLGKRMSRGIEALLCTNDGRLAPGTHYFTGDQLTRWLTVDQALVSREFLGGNRWVLNEAQTGPLQWPPLLSKDGKLALGFDHLPIAVTFEKS